MWMRKLVVLLLTSVLAVSLAVPANAATYRLPVGGGRNVLKIWVDHGMARRLENNGRDAVFEVTMDDDRCRTTVHVQSATVTGSPSLYYDVCSEAGFNMTVRR